MILGADFVFIASLITLSLLPLYIYRKHVFKSYYQKKDITEFIHDIKIYLNISYPKITFDFSIVKRIQKENDTRIQQTLIVENLINQFIEKPYSRNTQKPVKNNLLWSTYEQDSRLHSTKLPKDLARRKELAWRRDKEACNRCGNKIRLLDSSLIYAKEIERGGTFHFENLIIACSDCNRIIKSKDTSRLSRELIISDKLFSKVSL